jgi:Castor and Pollux, part of voltage-gated ion channel/Calcium-activated potassium channel slowpoke-like RCK domain
MKLKHQNQTFKRKLRYRFELFMNKGGSSIFLTLFFIFIAAFVLIVGIRAIIVYGFGYSMTEYNTIETFWDHIWYVFLQMTDPGNMFQDSYKGSGWIKVTTILSGIIGIIMLSALIAFITTELEKLLYKFRKGTGPILEENHTVILGWNHRVIGVIEELIIANESEKKEKIVILSSEEKEFMDDYISKNVNEFKTTTVITTNGNTASLNEFSRINIAEARSVIIMASSSDMATKFEKTDSDVNAMKSILALNALFKKDIKIPVIAEILLEENRGLLRMLNNKNIIALDNWDIMGKLLVQTSFSSGLQVVYNEILSFDLSEVYFFKDPNWEGVKFQNLPYHFPDGIPLGIKNEEGVQLRPNKEYLMKEDDEILILAEDDSTIKFSKEKLFSPKEQSFTLIRMEKKTKRVLILGWHSIGEIFVKESEEYLLKGSVFDVVIDKPSKEIIEIISKVDEEFQKIKVNIIDANPMSSENLEALDPFSYETILILATDLSELSEDRSDSNTLLALLMLQKIEEESGNPKNTKIITQILNSANQQLMNQTRVNDFIISNRMITMILAQLSEEPGIKAFYDDIFQEDGSEIYLKPTHLYYDSFPMELKFADLIDIAQKRDEICLGIRYTKNSEKPEVNFGVNLNIAKDETINLEEEDFLIVLSIDEL